MSLVGGTDFVALPTRDFEAAVDFYENVLGLPCSVRYGKIPGGKFETGNLTLQVLQMEALGLDFHATPNPIAMVRRGSTVRVRQRALKSRKAGIFVV